MSARRPQPARPYHARIRLLVMICLALDLANRAPRGNFQG
jgi:hypothetical protein